MRSERIGISIIHSAPQFNNFKILNKMEKKDKSLENKQIVDKKSLKNNKNMKNLKKENFTEMVEKEQRIKYLEKWFDIATISPIYPLKSGIYKGRYRFSLDNEGKYGHKICPQCGKESLVPYVDRIHGWTLGEHTGWCTDRKNCGYHKPPREYLNDHKDYYLADFSEYMMDLNEYNHLTNEIDDEDIYSF